jgi:hypothetical protein
MSLDNIEMVDSVGTSIADGTVILSIIDGWDWNDHEKHLNALQNKLNAYFNFIESGQIYESYPEAEGQALRIDIICKFPIPDEGIVFLEKATVVAKELNVDLSKTIL